MSEASVSIPLGGFQHGVKIRESFFYQFRGPLHNRARQMCSGIDLAAIEGEIDLGTGITDDEFRLLETDQEHKEPPGDIDLMSDRLRADSNSWCRP